MRTTQRSRRRGLAAVAAAVGAVLIAAPVAQASQAHSGRVPAVNPDSGRSGSTTTSMSAGLNTATWDPHLFDPGIPGALRNIHPGLLRFPGGSTADMYDWQNNTASGQQQSYDYQQFAGLANKLDATPLLTVNYGSGTPQMAAAWVNDAQHVRTTKAPLWEIGNEIYGPWETDQHPNAHTPQSYAHYSSQFLDAMLKANPKADIGVPYALTTSQAAGSGTGVANPTQWNKVVLGADGKRIGFVDVHWYPVYKSPHLSDSQIMAYVGRIPSVMRGIKANLAKYAPHAKVIVGETSLSQTAIPADMKPIAALYSAATVLTWDSQGAASVDWWDLHNSPAGEQGDFGLLSWGAGGEPSVNTPMPTYYGYQLASLLTKPGAKLTRLPSPAAAVLGFASHKGASHTVMLINSASTSRQVAVAGLPSGGHHVTVSRYSAASPKVTSGSTSLDTVRHGVRLPAESITVLSAGS